MKRLIISLLILFMAISCNPKKSTQEVNKKTPRNIAVKDASDYNGSFRALPTESNMLDWIRYPSISPDGKQIAFAYMGDIYITPVKGGLSRALTNSDHFESMPVWSHDNKMIAYLSTEFGNKDVSVIEVNGPKGRRLTYHSAQDEPLSFSRDNSRVYFSSARMDNRKNSGFPTRSMPELYSVDLTGKDLKLELSIPVFDLSISSDGRYFIYHDKKGYENNWRKHHVSSVTRDIWKYSVNDGSFRKLSDFKGENRSPVFAPDEKDIYYLSEESGSFNVWKLDHKGEKKQLTFFDTHPVRHLSISTNGMLCFSYHGQIYTMRESEKPLKISVFAPNNRKLGEDRNFLGSVNEIAVSPSGMEVAVVMHGEVYAVNPETGTTKRITETPNEERWVNFHPDGKKLLYSSFRNGSWNIYETSLEDKDELFFFNSTKLSEKPVIENDSNSFQGYYSPDGEKIAYLRERTELVVYNVLKKTEKTVLPLEKNLSYIDGDQEFVWSPDNRRIAVTFPDRDRWSGEIGIVDTEGKKGIINITNSGTEDNLPKWNHDGSMISWRNGGDIMAFFLNQKALDKFRLSKEEIDLINYKKAKQEKKPDKKKKEASKKKKPEKTEIVFETDNILERTLKISLSPAYVLSQTFSDDGEKLYLLKNSDTSFDIIEVDLREKKEKKVSAIPHKRNISWWYMPEFKVIFNKEKKDVFTLADHKAFRIGADGKQTPISPRALYAVKYQDEKEYLFEHVWKTVNDKFYRKNLHSVDWKKYHDEYARFIPHINNNFDFTEMLSEMLGELNVSHTGSGYIFRTSTGDSTGRLGIFSEKADNGIKIVEIIKGSPFDTSESKAEPGTVIEKIDGKTVAGENHNILLNLKVGKKVRVTLSDKNGKKRWEEVVVPIGYRHEISLLYERWVKRNKELVDKLSKGRLGYVHIQGMDMGSFRKIFDDIMGKYSDREGIVIDTRFNGGGWLHNELAVLFNGESYTRYSHRGQKNFGGDPGNQWTKKSILIVNEGNYSDAHLFPYTYRALKLGKIVGMPVPGTSTAVWWPNMLDPSMYFGIPQIGISDKNGEYLENKQLEPDYLVPVTPEQTIEGDDPQIEKAVEVLLEDKPEKADRKDIKKEKDKENKAGI